jgi:hypothetical protein
MEENIVCKICTEPVLGNHVSAASTRYHQSCFGNHKIYKVCCHCLEPFNDKQFFESEDFFYCEEDYNLICVSRCGDCEEPIKVLDSIKLGKMHICVGSKVAFRPF